MQLALRVLNGFKTLAQELLVYFIIHNYDKDSSNYKGTCDYDSYDDDDEDDRVMMMMTG